MWIMARQNIILGHMVSTKGIIMDLSKNKGGTKLVETQDCQWDTKFSRFGWILQIVDKGVYRANQAFD